MEGKKTKRRVSCRALAAVIMVSMAISERRIISLHHNMHSYKFVHWLNENTSSCSHYVWENNDSASKSMYLA